MSMRSNVLTLRTVKRGKDNALSIESDNKQQVRASVQPLRRQSTHPNINDTSQSQPQKSYIDEPVTLTATFHDQRTSDELIAIDISQLPGSKPGDVAELQPIDGNNNKNLLFMVKQMNEELLRRSKNSQVSIVSSSSLQSILGLSTRSPVIVKLKDKEEVEADLVEILIKDVSLTRGDMWELSSLMKNSCVFKSQRLTFMDSIRVSISSIYRFGKKRFSGYIGDRTKIVFRSESARLVFLIQITDEMYHFQEDGEVMASKVINSLFPTIFKRWREENTHHLITIVFAANVDFSEDSWTSLKVGERPKNTKDYYRVVVDQVNIVHWSEIMISLRYEFANFRKEIINHQLKQGLQTSTRFLPATKSDILNTINLSTTLVVDRFRDPDLKHTTNHFIVISAGNGLYDVEYDDLLDTGKRLLNSEISVDIICLTQPPLHVTPLFRYRQDGKLHHCVPGWIDVSYWTETAVRSTQWLPSCKIYELQMMGIMENDLNAVTIENLKLPENISFDSVADYMDYYDTSVFSKEREESTYDARPISLSSSKFSTPKRLTSSSSLRWKLSNSAITKTEPNTTATPIFSVSQTAIDSLQGIGKSPSVHTTFSKSSIDHKQPLSSDASSITTSIKSSLRPMNFNSTPPVSRAQDFNMNLTPPSFQQLKSNSIPLSSSPNQSTHSFKEKQTAIDSVQSTMWTEIQNISKKLNKAELDSLTVGKWQDVFPEKAKRRTIKWRSLLSPSELPVSTPLFPEVDDFEENFTFQNHLVTLSAESEKYMDIEDLFKDMIHLRLMLGFQICYGEKVEKVENKRKFESDSSLLIKYLPQDKKLIKGARIYLSLDEEIHRILCDYQGTINVQRYNRVVGQEEFYRDSFDRVMIKTRYQHHYHPYDPNPLDVRPKFINWNKYDQLLAGYEDDYSTDNPENNLKVNRMKFVLLPSDIPKNTTLLSSGGNNSSENRGDSLTQEETRVEGLRRLIATLHRGAFKPGEQSNNRRGKVKEEATPEINFYTGDLISFLEEQLLTNNLDGASLSKSNSRTLANDNLLTQDVGFGELARELQSSKGIKLIDRKWHWKLHKNCFLGLEFVTWIVDNFQDINTREEAIEYGNKLMEQGLIHHVENRHKFLDGYYFYRLEKVPETEDSTKGRSRSGSVGSKSSKFSMTPILMSTSTDDVSSLKKTESKSFELNNTQSKDTHLFILSHSLKYNLDPNFKSYKPEIIKVHYDTVHNPNHCFHIRLEWLTTTPKLIDDTINSWSRMCERYGLKLVETPWSELCEIPKLNPFHSYVDIKLAIDPWDSSNEEFYNEEILKESKFYYHIYLLEYSGFLMDNRASMFFQDASNDSNIEIRYSWGRPRFKYAQYIHKTGAYIAEIRDTGDLFLAPNNTHIARVNIGNVSIGNQNADPSFVLDSQKIMLEFRSTCVDSTKLREIFEAAKKNWEINNLIAKNGVLSPLPDDLLTL